MFLSKLPLLCLIQLLSVCGVVLAVLLVTGNALALLGLLLVWQQPPWVPPQPQEPDDDDEARGIGFTAAMGDDQ